MTPRTGTDLKTGDPNFDINEDASGYKVIFGYNFGYNYKSNYDSTKNTYNFC